MKLGNKPGSFIFEIEGTPFKWLFWNGNDSFVKLMVSITSGVSLWYRPCYKSMSYHDNENKCRKLTAI